MKAFTRSMALGLLNDMQDDSREFDCDVQNYEAMTNAELCDEMCMTFDEFASEEVAVIDDRVPGVKAVARSMAIFLLARQLEAQDEDDKNKNQEHYSPMTNDELCEAMWDVVHVYTREELDTVVDD